MRTSLRLILLFLAANLIIPVSTAADREEQFQRGMALCEAIPANAYETGLAFNPAGHRSYFKRSRCQVQQELEVAAMPRSLAAKIGFSLLRESVFYPYSGLHGAVLSSDLYKRGDRCS